MDTLTAERIETAASRGASALFGAAVGYAAYAWLGAFMPQPQLDALAALGGGAAYLACSGALSRVGRALPHFDIEPFRVVELDAFEPDELLLTEQVQEPLVLTDTADGELLLTDADRLPASPGSADPLILDDVLAELVPDSRVVRLFDRTAMPTAGELKSRIDDHFSRDSAAAGPADASQALSDALAELKRSLR